MEKASGPNKARAPQGEGALGEDALAVLGVR